jgi:hypothetical protein
MSEEAIKAALEAVQAPISQRSCSFFAKYDHSEEVEDPCGIFKSRWNRDDNYSSSCCNAWAPHCAKRMKIDNDDDEGMDCKWNNK